LKSIWNQSLSLPAYPSLQGDVQTDVAVIGGGMAGILTAHLLRQEGVHVIVLDANRVGSGQTGGTTAKLTAQHGLKYQKLVRDFGSSGALQYARAHLAAVEHLRRLVHEWNIACDFEDCCTYLYSAEDSDSLQTEYETCQALGMNVFLSRDTELPFPALALGLRQQAKFHPLKLLSALMDGLTIYEHSRVLNVDDHTLHTDRGSVHAETIIFTCHYPFLNIPGYYFARQHQERSYVLALEGAANFKDCYLGIGKNPLSFRSWGNFLLLGGGGHRTGENRQGGKYDQLECAARQYWPKCRIVSRWSAQDCIPMDGVPYIGQYAENRPHWLVATGFQKWGMSSSMVSAEILRDLALGKAAAADSAVFSPQRFRMKASVKQLTEDTVHAVRGLSRRLLEPGRISGEELPIGHGGVVELDGEKLGLYRNEEGALLAVSVKCPHMGCQLEWNPDEKSWDCPCHGSRFDVYGKLLEGPAQRDL